LVTDPSDVVDFDPKQMEERLFGTPAEHRDGLAVSPTLLRVIDWYRPASQFDLALGAFWTGDDAVYEDPVISGEVDHLSRLPHHRQPQVSVEEQWLDRAQPWRSVTPQCYDQ
jgi:hypothetical protein